MELFEHLPQEKKLSIINSAFKCFGKNGFDKTSIADIAAEAGISKASIFQYFGTKTALYIFLFSFACEKILQEIPVGTDDFFECLKIGSDTKMRVMSLYPGMYDFLSSVVIEESTNILFELKQNFEKQIQIGKNALFASVNWEKFRPEISIEQAINIIHWVSDGYLRSAVPHKDAQTMRKELWQYLEILEKAFYKEEFL